MVIVLTDISIFPVFCHGKHGTKESFLCFMRLCRERGTTSVEHCSSSLKAALPGHALHARKTRQFYHAIISWLWTEKEGESREKSLKKKKET